MSHTTPPTATPNVIIENPKLRRTIRTIVDVLGGLVFVAAAVDVASADFDIASITGPALAGYTVIRAVFGLTVDNANTPKV